MILMVMISVTALDATRFVIKGCATIRSRLGIKLPHGSENEMPVIPHFLDQRVKGRLTLPACLFMDRNPGLS
jgi:hypothetical protein